MYFFLIRAAGATYVFIAAGFFYLHVSLLLYYCASNNSQSLSLLALSLRGFTTFVHGPVTFSSARFMHRAGDKT